MSSPDFYCECERGHMRGFFVCPKCGGQRDDFGFIKGENK